MMEVDNCVDPVNGLKLAGNHSDRRITKSAMEKKRRARINTSLTELKTILAGIIAEKAEKFDKLEKADILELTVKYVKQLQRTSVKGENSMPDEKYRRGFNTCFNEVLKYISASDTCKPEMRAKVLSHLVDRFTNQNTAMNCSNQSSHVVENLNSQTASANQSQFLFNEIPNQIPFSAKQSVCEAKYRNRVISGEDRHNAALSVLIPNKVDGQKMNTPVLDQNNNIQHVQIDNVLDNLGKSKGQSENTIDNFGGSLPSVQGSGLVKITSPSATIPNSSKMQFIASGTVPMQSISGQMSSNQANYAGLSIFQPNTMVPSNVFKTNDTSLPSSPVQLLGYTNPSDSISTSQAKPIQTPPSMIQCLNYSALPFASPVDGNLTILVPANVIALPTVSPSGSGIFPACDGSGSASPISSVQSRQQSTKNTSSDVHNFVNVNNVQVPKKCVSQELNKVTKSLKPESTGSPIRDANKLVIQDRLTKPFQNVNRTRFSPYSITASSQTKPLDENVVADTDISNTNDCRRNNCDATPTFSTSVINTSYNLNHQMNVVPRALEFQTDKISSVCGLTDTQNKETYMKSYFPNQSATSYSSNVWRPWKM